MPTEQPLSERTIKLARAVYECLDSINTEVDGHIDKVTKEKMSAALTIFVESAIVKFMKGQKEHGGLITDRDMEVEIKNEMIDLFWYTQAMSWQQSDTRYGKKT